MQSSRSRSRQVLAAASAPQMSAAHVVHDAALALSYLAQHKLMSHPASRRCVAAPLSGCPMRFSYRLLAIMTTTSAAPNAGFAGFERWTAQQHHSTLTSSSGCAHPSPPNSQPCSAESRDCCFARARCTMHASPTSSPTTDGQQQSKHNSGPAAWLQ